VVTADIQPRRTHLQATGQGGLQWVGEALAAIPEDAATSADKQRFMSACQAAANGDVEANSERGLLQAVDELSELCRRNRRAAQLAQRALLPPELHYVVR
jgi:transportin-3